MFILKRSLIITIISALTINLTSCGLMSKNNTDSKTLSSESKEMQEARRSLETYFTLLSERKYEQAVDYCAGGWSYELLASYNEDVEPKDYGKLLKRGCEENGFIAMKVKNIVSAEKLNPTSYLFEVQFTTKDGNLFVWGEANTAKPPRSVFSYMVVKKDGRFLVDGLPPYDE